MKVEALNTHLGILGGCFADTSTADVFLLFLLVLQREDAMFLLFLVNLILDDSIKVERLICVRIYLISVHIQVEWMKNFGVKELNLVT